MKKCVRAAVFYTSVQPLMLENLPFPERIERGAVLCRVRCATICGSDIHTVRGRRIEDAPLILGHEVCGEICATGGEVFDMYGSPLNVGDRITWSIFSCCGTCFFCSRGMEQKCVSLMKYGHSRIDNHPGLSGGFAEYIHLRPGTFLIKIGNTVPDEIAATINCALATAVNVVRQGVPEGCESVLVSGAGLLGLNCVAYLKSRGNVRIAVTDVHTERLETASRFGADLTLNVDGLHPEEACEKLRSFPGRHGFDSMIEVCGSPDALVLGINAVRTGGMVLTAGLVTPGNSISIDPNMLIRKNLTIRGEHNYPPSSLREGVEFIEKSLDVYPYRDIVGAIYPLEDINTALETAGGGEYLRVGIR